MPIRIDGLSFQEGVSETGNSAVLTDPVTIDSVT